MLRHSRQVIYSSGYAASFFFSGYRSYRLAKRCAKLCLVPDASVIDLPSTNGLLLAIEGFRHSGNSFLRGNVLPAFQDRVVSHIHRTWMLRHLVGSGIPTVVLVRAPRDVVTSISARNVAVPDKPELAIGPSAALIAWILYYRAVLQMRDRLHIVTFDELTTDYQQVRRRIEAIGPVRLQPLASFKNQNAAERRITDLDLPLEAHWLLRQADRIHTRVLASTSQRVVRVGRLVSDSGAAV